MLRANPRMAGGTTALTASMKRKFPLPPLGGLRGAKTPLFGNSELLWFSFPVELIIGEKMGGKTSLV
jgi:hypothetical protein